MKYFAQLSIRESSSLLFSENQVNNLSRWESKLKVIAKCVKPKYKNQNNMNIKLRQQFPRWEGFKLKFVQ